jgi:hypothetical protein
MVTVQDHIILLNTEERAGNKNFLHNPLKTQAQKPGFFLKARIVKNRSEYIYVFNIY